MNKKEHNDYYKNYFRNNTLQAEKNRERGRIRYYKEQIEKLGLSIKSLDGKSSKELKTICLDLRLYCEFPNTVNKPEIIN